MDIAREGTPPGLRSEDFANLPPPERRHSERLLPEQAGSPHRSLPPVRSRSPSPQPFKSGLVPGALEDSGSASPKDKKKKKKKDKKKRSRGSSTLSDPGDFPEGENPESPESPGTLASSPIGLASMSSARTPCKFGASCYRKNPDHRRQYSHPGDADHPDTPAPAAEEAEPTPDDEAISRAIAEEEGIAETPSTPLRSASGIVASDAVGLGGVTFPESPRGDSKFSVARSESSLKPRSAAEYESGGVIESNVDLPDRHVEAVAVTPVSGSFATRTTCKFGEECWNTRPEHRARFAHPGDPDHPATASAGASPSHSGGRFGGAGLPSASSAAGGADSEPVVHIDPEPASALSQPIGPEERPTHSPAPMVMDDHDEEEEDDEGSRSAEIDFPDKARKRCGPAAKGIGVGLCLSVCLIAPAILLGFVFDNMVHLREDEQLLEPTWDGGERVTNGPGTVISWPHLRREAFVKRQADRLSQRQFAVLVNRRTQVLRHQKGPGLLFLRPMEDLVEIKSLKVLQLTQYHRLVDQQTGDERIVRGPRTYAPEPLERIVQPVCYSERPQSEGLLWRLDALSPLDNCKMKCSGMESCESFVYCSGIEPSCDYNGQLPTTTPMTTTPTTTTPTTTTLTTTTANVDNSSDNSSDDFFENSAENSSDNSSDNSSELRNNSGNNSFELSYSSSTNPVTTNPVTTTNPVNANSATIQCQALYKVGCELAVDFPEEAVMINAFMGIIVENKTSGVLRLEKTPGLFFPSAYEVLREWRHVKLIDALHYAVTKDMLTGATQVLPGPRLVMLEAYEELIKIGTKVVIKKDEFLRLVDKRTGAERVVVGPASVSPAMEEEMPEGVQKAVLLDPSTSAILLDQSTGQQQLNVTAGILAPKAYETILEVRPKVRVLDHQAVVSRAPNGQLTLHTSPFFLASYHEIFSLHWSVYANYAEEPVPKMNVSVIDLRVQRLPWRCIAITSDSVRIRLAGNTFWTVSDAMRMATSTEDAPSDVAQHSKAKLLSNIAKVNFRDFMASMTTIMDQTSLQQAADAFYSDRGLAVSRIEIVGFDAADDVVAAELRKTVVEVVTQVNRMMQAQTTIDVSSSAMSANIRLEKLRTDLIQQKAVNDLLLAMNDGAKEGARMAEEAKTFLNGLEDSINETDSRVDLYRRYHEHDAVNELTRLFSDGPAQFYLHGNETDIVLANFRSEL